jgi:hypothetical protein
MADCILLSEPIVNPIGSLFKGRAH